MSRTTKTTKTTVVSSILSFLPTLSTAQMLKLFKAAAQLLVSILLKSKTQKEGLMRVLHGVTPFCIIEAVKIISSAPTINVLVLFKSMALIVIGIVLLGAGLFSVKKLAKTKSKSKSKTKSKSGTKMKTKSSAIVNAQSMLKQR